MDVRISYGTDINKVPEKILDMLDEFDTYEANKFVDISKQLIELSNLEVSYTLLEKARRKLASLDRLLNDAQMILEGFVSAKTQPEKPEAGDKTNVD